MHTPYVTIRHMPDDMWTAEQCADYLKIQRRTWFAYVYRPAKRNPAPQPADNVYGKPLWDPADVKEYARHRARSLNT